MIKRATQGIVVACGLFTALVACRPPPPPPQTTAPETTDMERDAGVEAPAPDLVEPGPEPGTCGADDECPDGERCCRNGIGVRHCYAKTETGCPKLP